MQIFKQFLLSHSSYIQKMKICSYQYSDFYPNLHHLEKNIWAHTKEAYQKAVQHNTTQYVKYAILLHDLGRIYTRKENQKTKQVKFGHYEGVSVFASLEILEKFSLTKDEIIRVLKIISYQYLIIDYIKYNNPSSEELLQMLKYEIELFHDLLEYTKCDIEGRIIDQSIMHLYQNTKIESLTSNIQSIDSVHKKQTPKSFNAYILVGPPCSRKSTWVSKRNENSFVVSRDDCEEEIGKKYGITTYDESYRYMLDNEHIKEEINKLEEEKIDGAINGNYQNIVIDNPNMEIKKRIFWINAFKKTHNIHVVVFLSQLENLFECNKVRSFNENKSIKKSVVLTKLKLFYMPLLSEGMDDIEYIFNK